MHLRRQIDQKGEAALGGEAEGGNGIRNLLGIFKGMQERRWASGRIRGAERRAGSGGTELKSVSCDMHLWSLECGPINM